MVTDRREFLKSTMAGALAATAAAGVTRAHAQGAQQASPKGTKIKPGPRDVLLVVDVQNDFIPGGALAVKEGDAIVPLVNQLAAGFVPVRKLGKLPGKTIEVEYELEYGRDALAVHEDAIKPGQRVLAVDDLLATGGTMAATLRLVQQLGGKVVGVAFMIELAFLKGREKLKDYPLHSLIVYE